MNMKEIEISKIVEIIQSNLENMTISPNQYDDDLTTLSMDSITFIHIIVELEETFNCEIPDSKLLISEMNTINKIAVVLEEAISTSDTD